MNKQYDGMALLGRVLLSLIFVISGAKKIGAFAGTAGYIASKGLPAAEILTALTIAVELGGGLLLLVGFKARWAALALGIFSILAAVFFHNFWTMSGAEAMNNQIHFMKNICIAGGMFMVVAFGPGRFGIDKA
jgi:putative oxidoreductase